MFQFLAIMAVTKGVKMRVCTRCCMDTTAQEITFDSKGECNYCAEWDAAMKAHTLTGIPGLRHLETMAETIRASRHGDYDCVLGMSGGYDSSYTAYLAKRLDLTPYCISVDNGYDTDISVSNVRNLCRTLGFHHETIAINRDEFRDLQLAYLRAGVISFETPSDHAINASVYGTADRLGLKYIISGQNVVTEWTMPRSWGWDHGDLTNLRNIHKKFGKLPLKTFPTMGHTKFVYYSLVKGITTVPLLNYITYDKRLVKQVLERECGWTDYGVKHHESHITRFLQCYILPKYWGIDKRKAHLSCLIRAGQMTRNEALAELAQPPCSDRTMIEDMAHVCSYLGMTQKELDHLLSQPHHDHSEYGAAPRGSVLTKGYWLLAKLRGTK